ncbi:MAG TPA: histidine phosphatase family protein [Anaerolineae bacterium]|nr:histidine phosphatase family protein [Anaerolineae bacterium]
MNNRTELVLVRHGESEWTEKGLLHGGRLDSPLSPKGKRQAALAARRLEGEDFAALFSSPQGRAMQTAQILGEVLGLTTEPLDGLREYIFGWVEGKPKTLFEPDGTGPLLLKPLIGLSALLTGERPRQFNQRVLNAIHVISDRHPSGRILVVTHWGVLSLLMAALLDADPKRWREYGGWSPCGITELHGHHGEWKLIRMNDSEHLQE